MKKIVLAALIAALPLSALAGEAKPPSKAQARSALATAKQAILYQLKDPESARWRKARVARNGNVCVEVNAKNSFGGYTGFQLYFYGAQHREVIGNSGLMARMWCRHPVKMPKGSFVEMSAQ